MGDVSRTGDIRNADDANVESNAGCNDGEDGGGENSLLFSFSEQLHSQHLFAALHVRLAGRVFAGVEGDIAGR